MEIRKRIRKNPFYLLVSKPGIYIKSLLWNTILIGFFTLVTGLIINYLDININIPPSMHSLVGFVIGLLLVFRTNTSYDRWWEGRKLFSSTSHQIGVIAARISAMNQNLDIDIDSRLDNQRNLKKFKKEVKDFLLNLSDYLSNGDEDVQTSSFHIKQNKFIANAMVCLDKIKGNDSNVNGLYVCLDRILENSNHFERIKNTPIPLSYVLHIKMCILIYLLTLPFGMFHELGLFATPVVMLIYYIMGGVEIISTEIENPFADDPNDLPTQQLFDDMLDALKDK